MQRARRSPRAATDQPESDIASAVTPFTPAALAGLSTPKCSHRLLFGVKRAIDIGVSAAALLIVAPVFAVIAAAVLADSGRPVLFRARRVGKDGRVFTMYKFRTMVQDAEARLAELEHLNLAEGMVKIPNDPRVTRAGVWLRRFSLDELPQLWNVLRGDMSLIGPRPHGPEEGIPWDEPAHRARLFLRPGVTGLWQVMARDHPSLAVRVYYDLQYLARWSLWLDFKIMLLSVAVVLRGTGGTVRIDSLDLPEVTHLPGAAPVQGPAQSQHRNP